MADLIMPLPAQDFDPTESAVSWAQLTAAGHTVRFATPDGAAASADDRMVSGRGLGPWRGMLRARKDARDAYAAMCQSAAFQAPMTHEAARDEAARFDGLVLPGGHAKGMIPYLESSAVQQLAAWMMAQERPVGAICHGVVVLARSAQADDGRSVLQGHRVTALLASQELSAWWITRLWLGDYYRTYPETVQAEVTRALASPDDFVEGPMPLRRDRPDTLSAGFAVRSHNLVTARWPGDVYRFCDMFGAMLDGAQDDAGR